MSKTVKVRIAVVVANNGKWNAYAYSGAKSDKDNMDIALEGLEEDGEARYWVTAELAVPEEVNVQGAVEKLP